MGISDSIAGVYKKRLDRSTATVATGGTGAAATVINSDQGYINMPYEVFAAELGKFYDIFGPIKPINVSDYGTGDGIGAKALVKLGHHVVSMFLRIGEKITVVRNYADAEQYAYNAYPMVRTANPITAGLTDKTALDSIDRISAIDAYVSDTDNGSFTNGFIIARPYPTADDKTSATAKIAVEVQRFGYGCSWMYEYDTPTYPVTGGKIVPIGSSYHMTVTVPSVTGEDAATTKGKMDVCIKIGDTVTTLVADTDYTITLNGRTATIVVTQPSEHVTDTTAEYRAYYDASGTINKDTAYIHTESFFVMSFAEVRKNFPIASSVAKVNVYTTTAPYDWDDIENGGSVKVSRMTLLESYQVSLANYVDVGTNSIFIEDVINGVSPYIYVKGDVDGMDMDSDVVNTFVGKYDQYNVYGDIINSTSFRRLYTNNVAAISDDTRVLNEASIWSKLSETTTVDTSLLISYNPAVSIQVAEAANARLDALAIIQVGNIMKPASSVIASAPNGVIDPAIVSAYGRYGKVFVPETGKASFLPMSIIAGYLHSRIETVYDIKDLPAGYEYGEVPILALDVDVTTTDAIAFSDAHINTVLKKPKAGYVMWNAKTMLMTDSPLNRTAPVRVLLSIMKDLGDSLDSQTFRINNAENRAKIERTGNDYLSKLISLGRITGGEVFCDEDNNGAEVRKQKKMYVDMGVTFPGYSEFIYFTAIVGDDGVSISDLRIQR